MKRTVCFCLLFALLVSLIAGCTQKTKVDSQPTTVTAESELNGGEAASEETYENGLPKHEEVTLKFGIFDGGTGTGYVEAGIKAFEKLYPNVTIEMTASPDIQTLIDTKIGAGDDEDMFDLFCTNNINWRDLVIAGKLEALDEVWEYELADTPGVTIRENCQESTVTLSYCSGWPDGEKHVYGFPNAGAGYFGIYFNKQLFEENGWNQEPQTWSEFLDLCEDIKSAGIVPLVYPGIYPSYLRSGVIASKTFELAEAAGDLAAYEETYNNYGSDYFTSPYTAGVWEKISKLGELGYFHEGIAALTHTQSQMEVIQENAAMVATGSWVGSEMADSVPEGYEWGYMVIPFRETTDTPLFVSVDSNSFLFYAWANKPELNKAWTKEFLRILCNMDLQIAMAESGSVPSIRKDYGETPEQTECLNQAVRETIEYLVRNDVKTEPVTAGAESTPSGASLGEAIQYMYDNYTEIIFGEAEITDVLEECQKLVDRAWESN